MPLNLRLPTLGGRQLWTDVLFRQGWHIQQHAVTRHYRLLDNRNVRQAWGSLETCRAALDEASNRFSPSARQSKRVVMLLHGLGRSHVSMKPMARFIKAQQPDWDVLQMEYASTRRSIAMHAQALASVLKSLECYEQIDIVAHSLGNIVTRHYLFDCQHPSSADNPAAPPDRRLHRMVMLGPPNQGSSIARLLLRNPIGWLIGGPCGSELGARWKKVCSRLATPEFAFGIIAGGTDRRGFNPLLSGDDDLIVRVEETRLAGARDFLMARHTHTFLMDHADVQQATLQFLRAGYFVSEAARKPIPREEDVT